MKREKILEEFRYLGEGKVGVYNRNVLVERYQLEKGDDLLKVLQEARSGSKLLDDGSTPLKKMSGYPVGFEIRKAEKSYDRSDKEMTELSKDILRKRGINQEDGWYCGAITQYYEVAFDTQDYAKSFIKLISTQGWRFNYYGPEEAVIFKKLDIKQDSDGKWLAIVEVKSTYVRSSPYQKQYKVDTKVIKNLIKTEMKKYI